MCRYIYVCVCTGLLEPLITAPRAPIYWSGTYSTGSEILEDQQKGKKL
jgi:hypothetical protein